VQLPRIFLKKENVSITFPTQGGNVFLGNICQLSARQNTAAQHKLLWKFPPPRNSEVWTMNCDYDDDDDHDYDDKNKNINN
jgi:hypothetical protein